MIVGAGDPVDGLTTRRDETDFLAVLLIVLRPRAGKARRRTQVRVPSGFHIVAGIGGNRGQGGEIQLPVHGRNEDVSLVGIGAINIACALVPIRDDGKRYDAEVILLTFEIRLVHDGGSRFTVKVAVLVFDVNLQRIGGLPAEAATGIPVIVIGALGAGDDIFPPAIH